MCKKWFYGGVNPPENRSMEEVNGGLEREI